MKRNLVAAAIAAAFFVAPAWAQQSAHDAHHGPGAQMGGAQRHADMAGGGMMGGGMMGGGMMGGGMMGGGMMGGGMMGDGMMGGGMMGGGMMGGYAAVTLSDEQRTRIADIQRELAAKQREPAAKMRTAQLRMHDVLGPGSADEAAARKAYDELSAARKELFEATLEARMRVASVLTEEQRAQLRSESSCMARQRRS